MAWDLRWSLKTFNSVIDNNKIFIILLEKVSNFPPFYNLAVISKPELQELALMNSIDSADS